MKEARHYEPTADRSVKCRLCPKLCLVREGKTGVCRVRQNLEGKLYSQNYARISSYAVDPIEKKPLYHFYPGTRVLSVGTVGCNFTCQFCQNWTITHDDRATTVELTPDQLVYRCQKEQGRDPGCIGIAYTYSEPLVWYEYVTDTAALAKDHGLKNILVTNGSINPGPLASLLPLVDAMNIDVKSFDAGYYARICSGLLEPVKSTVEEAVRAGVHVEVTTLLVEDLNDDDEEVEALARWLAGLNADLPLHLSRYFPAFKMDNPPTSVKTMKRAAAIARRHLRYVYLGNVWGAENNSTHCPQCGALVLRRHSLTLEENLLVDGHCPECNLRVAVTGGNHEETTCHSPGG
ncbi:MAG: AmmeMemoRadiSam system radical SAM enzyme [Bacillota bacterium]